MADPTIASGGAINTIEFHFYAGKEGGLHGSQAIFSAWHTTGRDIVAMLNVDMTGYSKGWTSRGLKPQFAIINDNVNYPLTDFTTRVIETYTETKWNNDRCGYACSDHAAANKYGYPCAYVTEGEREYKNPNSYSEQDTIRRIDWNHVMEHTKMTIGFAIELGYAVL
jgi:bacterial leucyl aminopeptidase